VPNHLAAILASTILCQGCYLGHSRLGKTIAYSTNGAIAAGGIAVLVAAQVDHSGPPDISGLDRLVQEAGAIALVVAVCGVLINLAADAPPPAMPPPPAPAPAGSRPAMTAESASAGRMHALVARIRPMMSGLLFESRSGGP
jgi:hypothetical protein